MVLKRRAERASAHPHTIGRSHGIHAEPVTFGLKLAPGLCGVRSLPRPSDRRARGDRHLRHFRRGRHLRQYRSARGGPCRGEDGPDGGARLDAGHPARSPRHVLRRAGRRRLLHRAAGDRGPPSPAHRGARGGGIFLAGPEGLVGHAAQAQPGADREPDRPRPPSSAPPSTPAMENVALWHERDISHSSVERGIGPDATRDAGFRPRRA